MLRRISLVAAVILVVWAIAMLNVTVIVGSKAPSQGVSLSAAGYTVSLNTKVAKACNTGQPDPYPC